MPRKTIENFFPGNWEIILQELESLRRLVRTHGKPQSRTLESREQILAILRLYPGLSLKKWPSLAEEYGLKEWLAVPLKSDEYSFLKQLGQTLEELAYQTEHDPLTGLANRRAFEHAMDYELERTIRSGTSLSLAVLDLDDFKKVNDTHGHPCGDKVLVQTARVILGQTRRYDTAARTGGEEFGFILPGTGLVKAKAVMARILESIREADFICSGNGDVLRITCSIGLVCYKAQGREDAPDMVGLADKAMYEAKRAGKNRIVASLIPIAETGKATLVESKEKNFLFTGS
ncbi:MAG: GGDEF domain-containing protein [Thermodesulfobacteriota bacterium]|nr:GGDEF domain-containing protein [Thermodesulfobacteriota bacterium]